MEGERYPLRELRTLQDWFIRHQLNAVPDVAEVASVGGVVRTGIAVEPLKGIARAIPSMPQGHGYVAGSQRRNG
jgi:Cu/Ag efflux pump CusA